MAAQVVITGMPEYPNHYGCAPSSGAMVLGYWDSHGFPNLLPGDALVFSPEIKKAIASTHHIDDYWVSWGSTAADPWVTEGRPRPTTFDCIADFMYSSQFFTPDGWTNPDQIPNGLKYYALSKSASYQFTPTIRQTLNFTDQFLPQIDLGRPVLLFIKLGFTIDHVVAAYGYDDTDPQNPMYAAMDTFLGNEPGEIDWRPWSEVYGGVMLAPPFGYEVNGVPGDVNDDGCVNVSDILFVRAAIGTDGTGLAADLTGDGHVDAADVLYVRNRLGDGDCQQ